MLAQAADLLGVAANADLKLLAQVIPVLQNSTTDRRSPAVAAPLSKGATHFLGCVV